jgi:hypothetical protein
MDTHTFHYLVEEDWLGGLYCGITLKLNHKQRYINMLMHICYQKKHENFHNTPKYPMFCPYQPHPMKYGQNSDTITPEKAFTTEQGR